ncbi:hypothetical protein GDO86_007714 [Hymenochirus boettgeri]|uniref:RNA polymerase II subunit B1 CTD phosphatase RPAP2 homolog n=1 Tax=Hymenochirus boettgeri TaxID=247094 RepID=A0A8T2IYZ8_9PIPI|nr:hypothetical protein GDO86_007714 [Hymenochirus boettgeri]
MAEWTTVRSRKSRGKRSVNFQVGDLTSEDADTRKAAMETAIKRKIEAEKKALKIVEQLLEDDVSEDFLVECGTFIASAHYKDTVEERSIIQSCGYPICKKKLENVPKQKYKISTKTNKVYDITERKCFCSDFCFRASKYYEAQLPKSPIWIREEESPPEIKLLKEGKSGRTGVEIKLSEKRIKVKEIEKPAAMTNEFDPDSSNSDTDANNENEQPFVSSVTSGKGLNPGERVNTAQIGTVDNLENSINCNDQDHSLIDTTVKLQNCNLNDHELTSTLDSRSEHKSNSEVLNVSQRAVSKRGAEQLRKILRNSAQYQSALKDHPSPVSAKNNMLEVLTQTLNEWKTEDTLKYILGTNYVIELSVVKEAPPKSIDEFEDLDEDDLSEETNDHENSSLIVCENISKESLPFSGTSNTTKPLPDYAKIKEKTEVLQIRVKDFFKGHYILPEEAKYDQDDGNIARNNTVKYILDFYRMTILGPQLFLLLILVLSNISENELYWRNSEKSFQIFCCPFK